MRPRIFFSSVDTYLSLPAMLLRVMARVEGRYVHQYGVVKRPLSHTQFLDVQIVHCRASFPTSQCDHTSHNDALKIWVKYIDDQTMSIFSEKGNKS